eukprot:scaffold3315_cov55-Cyclotella_meneghiniana.AAC.3
MWRMWREAEIDMYGRFWQDPPSTVWAYVGDPSAYDKTTITVCAVLRAREREAIAPSRRSLPHTFDVLTVASRGEATPQGYCCRFCYAYVSIVGASAACQSQHRICSDPRVPLLYCIVLGSGTNRVCPPGPVLGTELRPNGGVIWGYSCLLKSNNSARLHGSYRANTSAVLK